MFVAYQTIEVPVAAKLATVGVFILQKDCELLPVGAKVELTFISLVATEFAQPFVPVIVYNTVAIPLPLPVTTPVLDTVAILELDVDQVPPEFVEEKEVV